MALLVPMYVLEYPLSRAPSFCWRGFARGMPSWVAPCSWLLSLIALAHLVWLAVQNGPGVPEIVNGRYVLDSRGRILRVLTQAEYLALTEAELRAFTTVLISFYFVTMMYWWYRRSHRQNFSVINALSTGHQVEFGGCPEGRKLLQFYYNRCSGPFQIFHPILPNQYKIKTLPPVVPVAQRLEQRTHKLRSGTSSKRDS